MVQLGDTFCTITKSNIKGNVNSVAFTVTAVTSATHAYDAAINHDPDGGSDGTTITMTRSPSPSPDGKGRRRGV